MTHIMDKMPCVKTPNERHCSIIACRQKAFRVLINNLVFLILAQYHADAMKVEALSEVEEHALQAIHILVDVCDINAVDFSDEELTFPD